MAWASKEEEAMNLVHKHMGVMKVNKKRELNELYTRLIFPLQGNGWADVKWVTHWGVTFVTMWDEEHLLKNIQFAMIQEMMGLGPQRYCVFFNSTPNFYSKLKLIMSSLPQEKIFLYPAIARLEGPFLQEPWLTRGRALCSRSSLTFDEYHANFVTPYP